MGNLAHEELELVCFSSSCAHFLQFLELWLAWFLSTVQTYVCTVVSEVQSDSKNEKCGHRRGRSATHAHTHCSHTQTHTKTHKDTQPDTHSQAHTWHSFRCEPECGLCVSWSSLGRVVSRFVFLQCLLFDEQKRPRVR